jgi:integrase
VEVSAARQEDVVKKLEAAGPAGANTTVADWAARWLADAPVRESTRTVYRKSVNRITPHIGGARVRDLTPGRVEQLAAALSRDGYHPNTVRLMLANLRTLLAAAVRNELIPTNPVSAARKPPSVKKEICPFSPEQLDAIIAACVTRGSQTIALLAATGCRVGEALGLDVDDFDPAAGTVSIRRTFDGEHGLRPPKSKHSTRTIRVPAPALPALRQAVGARKTGPLFLTAAGKRRRLDTVRTAWVGILKRLGHSFRNLHQLRHSVATMMLTRTAAANVAKYLGDTAETISRTYAHPTAEDPADVIEVLLGGNQVGARGKVA